MRYCLILEDENGNRIDMTSTANKYMTSEIEGLNPPDSTISMPNYAGMNGSYLNNAFIEKRNILINFEMRGTEIEKNRHELYKIVKPSRYIKIFYRTKNIDVYAVGYVETCNLSNFSALTSGQISILCPDIYFYSTSTQIAEFSKISGEISEGDIITITTKIGEKSVILERGGVTENIINRLVSGSTWLTLREGENKFYLRASSGLQTLKVQLIHRNAYLGV